MQPIYWPHVIQEGQERRELSNQGMADLCNVSLGSIRKLKSGENKEPKFILGLRLLRIGGYFVT